MANKFISKFQQTNNIIDRIWNGNVQGSTLLQIICKDSQRKMW